MNVPLIHISFKQKEKNSWCKFQNMHPTLNCDITNRKEEKKNGEKSRMQWENESGNKGMGELYCLLCTVIKQWG